MQPLERLVCLPTLHFASRMFESPIFKLSVRLPTWEGICYYCCWRWTSFLWCANLNSLQRHCCCQWSWRALCRQEAQMNPPLPCWWSRTAPLLSLYFKIFMYCSFSSQGIVFFGNRPMRFPSPMKIGPASARILAFGWITVRGPIVTWDEQHLSIMIHEPESLLYLWTIKINWKLATSPFNSHSLQTTAPAAMVTFALALIWKITLSYHSWWPTHNS